MSSLVAWVWRKLAVGSTDEWFAEFEASMVEAAEELFAQQS
jgi:hypothetical protein